jgi:lipopolysaccharide export system protein LptA
MKRNLLLLFMLFSCLIGPSTRGTDDLAAFTTKGAKMPIYNNGKLTILAYSKSVTRNGIDIILKDAIIDIIKPGIDVDEVKYVDGKKPYPLDAPLIDILKFWAEILHSDGLIFSNAASISQKTRNARSNEKIFFRSPIMDVNGVGFQADFTKRTVKILKDVIIKIRQTDTGDKKLKLLPGKKTKGKTSTATVTADQMFIDFTNNFITVSGNVKVHEENMSIDCEKITVYLKQENDGEKSGKSSDNKLGSLHNPGSSRRVSRIVCENNVVIRRKQSAEDIKQHGLQQAFADKADYDFVQSKIVMTGKRPTSKRGNDIIEGEEITIWRDKEHLLARGDCRLSFTLPDKKIGKTDTVKKPTVATADFMDMNYAENIAVMTGNVKVVDQRMKIDCHKMNIYLEDRQKKASSKVKKIIAKTADQTLSGSKVINKIACIGDVTIFRLDGELKDGTQKAMAGKAVYHLKEGKIILSENNPIIIRGRDSVNGEIITVWVDQQKMHVDKNSLIVLNTLKNAQGKQPAATRVNSDYTNIDYGRNLMSFAGRVKIENPQLMLDCKKMLIFLEDKKAPAKTTKPKTVKSDDPFNMKSTDKEVSKVICLGDVYARDKQNKVRCQKLTLMMQDKKPGIGTAQQAKNNKAGLGGNREISRIICKEDVVMIRRPDPAASKNKPETPAAGEMSGKLLAGSSDKPITVKTDFMDLKLAENYGELIGNVDIDEPRVHLKCDKMELYAKNTPVASAQQKTVPKLKNADDEFDNETDSDAEVSSGDGSVPKKISLGDDKQLEKIICLRNVVITRKITANDPIRQEATGDKAVYFIEEGKIEMTENPALRQGDQILPGKKITLWTDSEKLDIEGGVVKEL